MTIFIFSYILVFDSLSFGEQTSCSIHRNRGENFSLLLCFKKLNFSSSRGFMLEEFFNFLSVNRCAVISSAYRRKSFKKHLLREVAQEKVFGIVKTEIATHARVKFMITSVKKSDK